MSRAIRFFIALTLLVLLLGNLQWAAADPANPDQARGHTTDSLQSVQQRLSDGQAVLVDVRELSEWRAGHLSQAVLVPLSRLRDGADKPDFAPQLAKKLPPGKIIYCHCRSGGRVLVAAPILAKLGYDARPLKSGYADLLQAGFEKAP